MADDEIEQTLHIAKVVQVYRIPLRGPTGHVSGEWKVTDKLFEGRLRIVSKGANCEIRFEDVSSSTGELFASAPIPYGKRTTYVETAIDSSRNFVVRVEDAQSKQHAFLGMSFTERSDSFDFNEALLRHEKHVERERAAQTLSGSSPPAAAGSSGSSSGGRTSAAEAAVMQDVKALYASHEEYSLKEGQTIRVNLQKKAPKPGGLMSSAPGAMAFGLPLPKPAVSPAFGIAPPPPSSVSSPAFGLAPPPPPLSSSSTASAPVLQPPPAQQHQVFDLL